MFTGLLVQRAKSFHHLIEQNRLLPARSAAQVWRSLRRADETEDKDRLFSERYYGRFERRIPVEEVDEDKVSAAFKNGVLTVTMPKAPQAQSKVKRIAVR